MAAIPLKVRGLNVVLVVFSLLVLGGSAYIMEQNLPTSVQTRASNVTENVPGKLVKKGTKAFSPCSKVATNYALIDANNSCTPLTVQSSIAEPLVGKQVIATGTTQNGEFFATSISLSK